MGAVTIYDVIRDKEALGDCISELSSTKSEIKRIEREIIDLCENLFVSFVKSGGYIPSQTSDVNVLLYIYIRFDKKFNVYTEESGKILDLVYNKIPKQYILGRDVNGKYYFCSDRKKIEILNKRMRRSLIQELMDKCPEVVEYMVSVINRDLFYSSLLLNEPITSFNYFIALYRSLTESLSILKYRKPGLMDKEKNLMSKLYYTELKFLYIICKEYISNEKLLIIAYSDINSRIKVSSNFREYVIEPIDDSKNIIINIGYINKNTYKICICNGNYKYNNSIITDEYILKDELDVSVFELDKLLLDIDSEYVIFKQQLYCSK